MPRYSGVERVGVDDSFFDLGGDSLSAMRVIAAINTTLDIQLAVRTLFEAPSVSKPEPADRQTMTGSEPTGPALRLVHGHNTTEVHAADLTLDKFIDAATLTAAPTLPRPERRGADCPADRGDRLHRTLPGPGMAASGWTWSTAP